MAAREAVRAVHDALPLLRMSRSVEIVTMNAPSAEGKDADAKSLSAHLANHGIEVETNVLQLKTAEEQSHYESILSKAITTFW